MNQHEEVSTVSSGVTQEEDASTMMDSITQHESGDSTPNVTSQKTNDTVHTGYINPEYRYASDIEDIMTSEGSPWAYQYWSGERVFALPHLHNIPHLEEKLRSQQGNIIQMAGRTYVKMDAPLELLREHIYKVN